MSHHLTQLHAVLLCSSSLIQSDRCTPSSSPFPSRRLSDCCYQFNVPGKTHRQRNDPTTRRRREEKTHYVEENDAVDKQTVQSV
ncbi:hypothetical protein BC567DRAFT_220277 [Phyllosticta citribraziliensis]